MNENIYDTELQKINGLTWLPWIGENYPNLPPDKKILLIGESHYYTTEEDLANQKSHTFTRRVVLDMAINGNKYRSRFFENINKLFAKDRFLSHEQKQRLWSNFSFYNIVQRPMNTKKGRPSKDDFIKGWIIFFALIKIIKPTICVFLGTSIAQHFSQAIRELKISHPEIAWEERINGAYAKYGCLTSDSNKRTELIFIKHPSARFTTHLWREYLEKKIPAQISWLNDTINT